jgi:hypothetical protein
MAQWPSHPQPRAPRAADGRVRLDAPAPRLADGKPDFSGVWEAIRTGTGQVVTGKDVPPLQRTSQFWNIGAGLDGDLPLRPWARELRDQRIARNSADNPDAHCLPIGITQLHNHPQPRKIIHTPTLLVMLYEANSGVRQIFLDGRKLPDNDPQPWWYGYSLGRWEGDTLVVETSGFRDGGWLDVNGAPLTDAAKMTERCLSSAASGAPMIPGADANVFQFVQTPAALAIVCEKYHEVRIIPIGAPLPQRLLPSWPGTSAGRWEGDTLVVETAGFHPGVSDRGQRLVVSDATRVVERFTRTGPAEILYVFDVTDPVLFSRSWRGEAIFRPAKGLIYEYACHEGNYALADILAIARHEEAAKGGP